MFELFRSHIKEMCNWSDTKFDLFTSLWEEELKNNIGQYRLPFIYTKDYMNSLLYLFFIVRQQDLGTKRFIVEEKGFFLALVSFYIVEDLRLQQQTSHSLTQSSLFFKKLVDSGLFTTKDTLIANSLIFLFSNAEDVHVADSVVTSDALLLRDMLLYNDPVVVSNRSCMFYYGEPKKTLFKFLKEDVNSLTPELFFDKCFSTSQKIHNIFIKRLFTINYQKLMEVQGKDKIFPF